MERNNGFSMTKIPEDGTPSQEKVVVTSKSQTAGEMWHEFVNSTNLHGIRYVFLKRPLVLRLIWLVILLTSGGYYIFTVVRAFNKFYARPINTVVSKSYVKEMDFPAITICSLNFFSLSKVLMMDDNPLFASSSLNISTCAITASVRQTRPCGLSLICCCVHIDQAVVIPNCTKQYKEDLLNAINRSLHLPDIEAFYQHYSQDISEILGPWCAFGWEETPCYASDFVPHVTPWGMCYTFNSGVRSEVRAAEVGGVSFGLTVALDAQLPEYTQGKFSEGFKVLVHGQGEYFDEWEGINVAPGTHVVIGVSQQRFKNLEKPYATNCVEKKLKMFNTYTSEGCLEECLAEAVIKSCGCRPIGYKGASGVKVCTTKKDTTCVASTDATLDEDVCGCKVPCNQIKYVTDVSYSKFPDRGTLASLLQSGFYSDETYIRENLVLLQVGFKSLSYEKFEQQPAYDSNALFGEIGGNMGLFLGCSLLTIFEFADFLIGLLAARRGHILHPA